MSAHDAGNDEIKGGGARAWSTWLVREMAAAADQPVHRDLSSESVGKAISECAELLGRHWPGETDGESALSARAGDGEQSGAVDHESVPSLDAPQKLDRFEIREPLGHGGFGIVFRVFDPRLNREAALKIPRPEILVSLSSRQRFLREAQAAAVLDHPNILPIYEIGEIGPVTYILSAYCCGPTLAAWQRDQAAPIRSRTAAQIICQLADAVHHAHSRGVLHRDIKPSNILLEPVAEPGAGQLAFVPRLTDFGLAKRLDSVDGETQAGAILGTPRYMAPEQAAGEFQSISVQTDVYALGAVLYELLAGSPPISGDSDRDTLTRIQEIEVSPAPLRNRHVARDLEKICCKCLEKKQPDRYGSARELADDLRRYLAGEPVVARAIGRGERLIRSCRRRPAVAALSLSLIAALVLGMTAAGWQWYRAESHLGTAQTQTVLAEQRLVQAEKQTTLAHKHLVQAENALVDVAWLFEESALWSQEGGTFRDEMLAKLNEYHRRVLQDATTGGGKVDHSPIEAAILSASARSAGLAGDAKTADRDFRLALDRWRQLVVEHPDNPGYRRGLSLCLFKFSEFERDWHRAGGTTDPVASAQAFYRNVRDDQRFGNWSLQDYAQVVLERGNMLLAPRPKEAVEVYRLARIAVETLLEVSPDDPRNLILHGQLLLRIAKAQRRLGEPDSAESVAAARDSLQRVVAMEPTHSFARVELAETLRLIGILARHNKQHPDAEAAFTQAIGQIEPILETRHDLFLRNLLAEIVRELAYVQVHLGKKDQALDTFGRCRELWRPARDSNALSVELEKTHAVACHDEGKLAQELNRSDIARAAFAEGVAAFRLLGIADDESRPDRKVSREHLLAKAECHFYLGRHQAAAGETQAARSSFQTAVNLLKAFATQTNASPPIKDIYAKATKSLEELRASDDNKEGSAVARE